MEAVQVRSPATVEALVAAGADMQLKNKAGKMAIDYVAGPRNGACERILRGE